MNFSLQGNKVGISEGTWELYSRCFLFLQMCWLKKLRSLNAAPGSLIIILPEVVGQVPVV